MSDLVLSSLYFILPAYTANMGPVFAGTLRLPLGQPIHAKLFGSHKSYRGFYAGFLMALLTLWVQQWLQSVTWFEGISLIDYTQINLVTYAFAFGIGALTGDLVKSFFKRRLGRKPGSSWFPFDQLDLVIGALIFVYPLYQLDLTRIIIILIATPLLHFLTCVAGYWLGMKEVWW